MAEGSSKVVCRFFATTGCREGDNCAFSHDKSGPNIILDNVCRFFLIGKCIYGVSCRYSHVRPDNSASSALSRNNNNNKNVVQANNVIRSITPTVTEPRYATASFQGKDAYQNPASKSTELSPSNWVYAPEFIPRTRKSYADTLKPGGTSRTPAPRKNAKSVGDDFLCRYFEVGECPEGDRCCYVHGEVCELCGKACLLPFDKDQQKRHLAICEQELEKDMELSFAVQRSADKTCGICMDVIMEKEVMSDRRFGILEKCNHIFCLLCIRKWREVKRSEAQNVENMLDPIMTRACPECRVPSDFITPSQFWVDNEIEKKRLIDDYKSAMHKKPCKHFDQGRGKCPFGGACFYLHAYPNGQIAELPPPKPRRRQNQNGDIALMDHVLLWDFLEFRDEIHDDWDIFYGFTDSDDSDNTHYFD